MLIKNDIGVNQALPVYMHVCMYVCVSVCVCVCIHKHFTGSSHRRKLRQYGDLVSEFSFTVGFDKLETKSKLAAER